MADSPSISVVIPAYNREATVLTAIRSVLWQTLPPTEVIVVDDGSTDGTAAVVEALGDPKVRLVRQANGGAAAARNTGIREARCEWVAFQDSDDEWLATRLERQFAARAADPAPADVLYCGMFIAGTLGDRGTGAGRCKVAYHPDPSIQTVSGELLRPLLHRNLISTQTLVARRQTLHAVGLFDEGMRALEDWDLAIRLAQLGPIGFVDEPLVVQRFSANSITRNVAKHVDTWIYLLEKHAPLFASEPEAHARQLQRIAGNLRRLGQHEAAAPWFRRARAAAPLDPRIAAASLLNSLKVRR